jgi:methylenetetrahydrofolate--tRNA-(uracil-5-)-methyltransferase
MSNSTPSVAIIGAGLAGCEAALVLAGRGVAVELFEMRPGRTTEAHKTALPAELVCSNSLKSDQLPSAHGLLKAELSLLGSPLLRFARESRVPAGSALAVDRDVFSRSILKALEEHPLITLTHAERSRPPDEHALTIVAAGPLSSPSLTEWLTTHLAEGALHFYDAIAPIVSADSIDMSIAFLGSRRQEERDDYCNCPFTEEEYRAFYDALVEADRVDRRSFEDARFFEACLPVEVVAQRGFQSLAFGTMKPVGFVDPRTGRMPYALCQLRRENVAGTSFNMVGFQTRLTIPEQKRVFRMIPGLEGAEFLRFGSIHRNTYLDSPRLLCADLSFRREPRIFLAGQLCGNEGYTESIATGHLAALFVSARLQGSRMDGPLPTSACGALLRHVTASDEKHFSPSNINFGLLDPLPPAKKRRLRKRERNQLLCERALEDIEEWVRV